MPENAHRSPLHAYVFMRFREAFGEPTNSLHRDDHWTLVTLSGDHPVNVLVNGSPSFPAVWVFDQREYDTPVFKTALASESEVDDVVLLIQRRVARRLPKHGENGLLAGSPN